MFLPATTPPAEDAAILFRYSEELAEHGVIRFNSSGPAVEGATDFLWMIALACGAKFGLSPYLLARVISLLSLWATILLLQIWLPLPIAGSGRWFRTSFIWIALLFNSQSIAAWEGFSLLLFGFSGLLCWYFFSREQLVALTIGALILGLIRPDGVMIGLPLVAILLWRNRKEWIKWYLPVGICGLMGLSYFLWRWWYFGLPLPLPFYVKSQWAEPSFLQGGSSFRYELIYMSKYLAPLILALLLVSLQRRFPWTKPSLPPRPGGRILSWASVGIPLVFYGLFSLEQNIADRFMYPVHLAVLSWFTWHLFRPSGIQRLLQGFAGIYLILSVLYFVVYSRGFLDLSTANPPKIAQALSTFPNQRLATTEAGWLPYDSGWESMDLWGLNHPELAKRVVSAQDLSVFSPDLIVLDAGYDWQLPDDSETYQLLKSWDNMVHNTALFAIRSDEYELWLVPFAGTSAVSPTSTWYRKQVSALIETKNHVFGAGFQAPYPLHHWYWIAKGSPYQQQIRAILQAYGAISLAEFELIQQP
ncbi:MAG: hypothetical protein AAF399_24500 [Bacteroidota bacterium]